MSMVRLLWFIVVDLDFSVMADYSKVKVVPVKCFYNPSKDICSVVQGDIVDLRQAYLNGSIPDNVAIPDVEYDGNENPESIIGKPANAFEAIHMQETIAGLAKKEES